MFLQILKRTLPVIILKHHIPMPVENLGSRLDHMELGPYFVPFLWPCPEQSSLVLIPSQHHRKMNPLESASKEEYFSLISRALDFCQPLQTSFFSPGSYACFYLSKIHEFGTRESQTMCCVTLLHYEPLIYFCYNRGYILKGCCSMSEPLS